ncbi:MAG: choice-of-anchor A family protein [Sumerlaeia bacterium]
MFNQPNAGGCLSPINGTFRGWVAALFVLIAAAVFVGLSDRCFAQGVRLEAAVQGWLQSPQETQYKLRLVNGSPYPTAGPFSARLFFDLSEVFAAGLGAQNVVTDVFWSQCGQVSIGPPAHWHDDVYYIQVEWIQSLSPGQSCELQLRPRLSGWQQAWNGSNDPAYQGLSTSFQTTSNIPVYAGSQLVFGSEPFSGEVTATPTPTPSPTASPTAAPLPGDGDLGPCVVGQGLDVASGFNVFLFGDISQTGTDTEGRMAVGGDAALASYSVGSSLPFEGVERVDLIVGGHLDFSNGSVNNGSIVYSKSVQIAQNTHVGGTVEQGSPIDFWAAESRLLALSDAWRDLAPTGSTTVHYWGGSTCQITLAGTEAETNVFVVQSGDLWNANTFSINIPSGSSALVNIAGEASARMRQFGFALANGVVAERVIFTLPTRRNYNSTGWACRDRCFLRAPM